MIKIINESTNDKIEQITNSYKEAYDIIKKYKGYSVGLVNSYGDLSVMVIGSIEVDDKGFHILVVNWSNSSRGMVASREFVELDNLPNYFKNYKVYTDKEDFLEVVRSTYRDLYNVRTNREEYTDSAVDKFLSRYPTEDDYISPNVDLFDKTFGRL